jgi:superfamily II DNA/RNA helicase
MNTTVNIESLGVAPFLCERLLERSIQKPLEIQSLVIPRLLAGESLFFCAPTGTGKTFAYLLPLLQRLFLDNPAVTAQGKGNLRGSVQLLVCAPTLELCSQIKSEADFLCKGLEIRTALIIGSAALERQIETLKKEKPAVVIGNPGRLLQLANMRRLRLDAVRALVLDEGDRLVSDEAISETEALIGYLPKERQTTACSATLSAKSRERLLPFCTLPQGAQPAYLEAKEKNRNMEHWAFFAENRKKISCLRSLLAAAKPKKALVFTARGADAGNILSQLQFHHFAAAGIWGDMDKKARKAAMDGFRKGNVSVLVASDLACRGLDIPDLTHVIALDVPTDSDLYLHRSGRTGRTGKRGIMASIGNEEELRRLQKIEKKLGITVYPKELYGGKIAAPVAIPAD